jgi:hypothetical protein
MHGMGSDRIGWGCCGWGAGPVVGPTTVSLKVSFPVLYYKVFIIIMSMLQMDNQRVNEYGQKDEKSLGKSKQKTSNEHLIPLLAVCHWTGCSQEVVTFNCRPQDWSLGTVCNCCSPWWVTSLTGLKQSDVQGEVCRALLHFLLFTSSLSLPLFPLYMYIMLIII